MTHVQAIIKKEPYTTSIQTEELTFLADEPLALGGLNLGPTPKDLLAGALASCTTITLRMYADRKEWPLEKVLVDVTIDTDTTPGQTKFIKKIELVGAGLTDEMKMRLLQIADKCPVHKILTQPITIEK